MAFLIGFPPSNNTSCITRIPNIEEVKTIIGKLEPENKFRCTKAVGGAEFLFLGHKNRQGYPGAYAVCYKGDGNTLPGHIYGFSDDLEVIWYKAMY